MKLEFASKKINEFYDAGLHFINDCKPIEVPAHQGGEMLKAITIINDERVPVFKAIGGKTAMETELREEAEETKREQIEAASEHADELRDEVLEMVAPKNEPIDVKPKRRKTTKKEK